MDPASEALMRSALHDLANVLSGIRGILELADPDKPLTPRDQSRLEAVIADGMIVLDRARHLAMGTQPEPSVEAGLDWRHQTAEMLKPLGVIFRKHFEVIYEGDASQDRWPGDLLRGYVVALTRQILPYVQGDQVQIQCSVTPSEWRLLWPQATVIPESLNPQVTNRPRDISARWGLAVGESLGALLHADAHGLTVRIPRF